MDKKYILIILLLAITVYTRFVNLNWDRGWGLHPDENNLWGASRNVTLFSRLDPNFYAYGGFPIYVYSLLEHKVQARTISAAVQTFIVLLLFFLGKKFAGWSGGISSAAMGTFSAGLVQAAHFLTVESLLGLFGLLIVFCLLEVYETSSKLCKLPLIAAAIALGLGIGTKTSFVVFVLPFFLLVLRSDLWKPKVGPLKALLMSFLALSLAFLIFLLTNPYIFDRWESIRGTLTYEANVATGKLPVFYTREFIDTIPGWFQAIHVFPYITGWLFLPMFLIGMFVIYFKNTPYGTAKSILFVICISALLSFLPLWATWTRYVVQVLPLLILIAGIGASWFWKRGLFERLFVAAALISFLSPFFSMLSVYQNQDTRLAAAKWAASHIDGQAKIFTEAMDLGILPFNPTFGQNIKLFNFYELDEVRAEEKQRKLDSLIQESDYFILLSRRVYKNSLDHSDKFPRAAKFYKRLFDGSLGYKKIYESSQVVIPAKARFDSARRVEPGMTIGISPEETFEVFDNPKVMIFRKI